MSLSHTDPSIIAIRQTAAQVLAAAVFELFPNVLLLGGGITDYGFYYDFIFEQAIDYQMLELLNVRMKAIIKENRTINSLSMMRENAFSLFNHHHQPFLAELALDQEYNVISLLQIGSFYGIAPEPHVSELDEIKGVKLLEIEKLISEEEVSPLDKPTFRIIGTAFDDPQSLKQFVKAYEKLKKFDHRLLGPQLGLYDFSKKQNDYFWLPNGEFLRSFLIKIWKQGCESENIPFVSTPPLSVKTILQKANLHLELNKMDENHPELPKGFGELYHTINPIDNSHIWGLFNKEAYLSDLVTLFCWEDQVDQKLIYSLQLFEQIITIFGFETHWYLSSSKNKKGRGADWLRRVLKQLNIVYTEIDSDENCPRLEGRFIDVLGREWAGPSISIIRHGEYKKAPVVITRTLFGSIDRMIGLLVEHYKGEYPFWLAPEQVRILVLGEQNRVYAQKIYSQIKLGGYRVGLDITNEKLGSKIHLAEKECIPYLVLIGDNERNKERISIRSEREHNRTTLVELEKFLETINIERSSWELKSKLES